MLRARPRRALGAAGAAAPAETASFRNPPNRPHRSPAPALTHPHNRALAPPRRHDPTTPATTAPKAFSTFAPPSPLLPPSHPSTPNRRRHLVNWRARPPSLCRPSYPAVSSPRRFAASPIMAQEWTGIKVRKTFFDFFAERGHSIGMWRPRACLLVKLRSMQHAYLHLPGLGQALPCHRCRYLLTCRFPKGSCRRALSRVLLWLTAVSSSSFGLGRPSQ